MALFKIQKGTAINLKTNRPTTTEGYCYFTTDDGKFYIDITSNDAAYDSEGKLTDKRICLNAAAADKVANKLNITVNSGDTENISKYSFDGSTVKNINFTTSGDGISISSQNNAIIFANTGVTEIKGNDELTYRTGAVNITATNILGSTAVGTSTNPVYWTGTTFSPISSYSGNAATADQVNHALTLTINSAISEGPGKYTFDGSSSKALNISSGNGIYFTIASGELSINSDVRSVANKQPLNGNISLGTLSIGNQTYNGSTDVAISIADLGLASPTTFLGITSTPLVDEGTTSPIIITVGTPSGSVTPSEGNIAMREDTGEEFVYLNGTWHALGLASSYALQNHNHGYITHNGTVNSSFDIATGDGLAVINQQGKLIRGNTSFNTSVTNKALGQNGIWVSIDTVLQTATANTNASYEILFSETADNVTRTEGARKNSALLFNPSGGLLTTTNLSARSSVSAGSEVYIGAMHIEGDGMYHEDYGDYFLEWNGDILTTYADKVFGNRFVAGSSSYGSAAPSSDPGTGDGTLYFQVAGTGTDSSYESLRGDFNNLVNTLNSKGLNTNSENVCDTNDMLLVAPKYVGGTQRVYVSDATTLLNAPSAWTSGEIVAYRQVMAFKDTALYHAVVLLYEVYPNPSRIWINTYNTSWKGWRIISDSRPAVGSVFTYAANTTYQINLGKNNRAFIITIPLTSGIAGWGLYGFTSQAQTPPLNYVHEFQSCDLISFGRAGSSGGNERPITIINSDTHGGDWLIFSRDPVSFTEI